MKYYKIEVVSDGYFPMDGSTDENAVSTISEHLNEIGLTVLDVIVTIVEEKAVPTNYIREEKTNAQNG